MRVDLLKVLSICGGCLVSFTGRGCFVGGEITTCGLTLCLGFHFLGFPLVYRDFALLFLFGRCSRNFVIDFNMKFNSNL